MDPQHRVFIQESWAALENAALPPKQSLQDAVVGVFAAAGIDGYMVHHLDGKSLKDTMNPQDIFLTEIGNEKDDYIATRVSYLLDFTGPSMNVNSACSSALVAVAQAAAAVAANQCDAAVAGASSITFPNLGYLYSDGLVSSKDGFVRPFDAGADGTVFGDSVAAMVLRRQEDGPGLLEDVGESGLLYAGLRGFAVSNDGAQKAGYAAPSSNGQARAIQDPWSISYVECHCTGTRIGDGIEIHGLLSAFENAGSDTTVALGSVKGNIAHANCAAGATGLIKALAMMGARSLAPTANFKQLNPKINLENTPFFVNSEVCQWNKKKPLRTASWWRKLAQTPRRNADHRPTEAATHAAGGNESARAHACSNRWTGAAASAIQRQTRHFTKHNIDNNSTPMGSGELCVSESSLARRASVEATPPVPCDGDGALRLRRGGDSDRIDATLIMSGCFEVQVTDEDVGGSSTASRSGKWRREARRRSNTLRSTKSRARSGAAERTVSNQAAKWPDCETHDKNKCKVRGLHTINAHQLDGRDKNE
eukprot:s267_g15.t1